MQKAPRQIARTERLIWGRNGTSNRNGAARTLRAQKQLTLTQWPRMQAAPSKYQARARLHRERHPKCKKENTKARFVAVDSPHFDQRPSRFASDNHRQPAPGQCSLASWFTSRLQPALVLIQARVYASFLGMVNPLPSAFVRLRSLSCSWQHSRREILEAKSPSLSSTVKMFSVLATTFS
jgi:hypothetical protein